MNGAVREARPISFGGRDRTCIAGSRGQRPAIRRPRSSEGTRSPFHHRSARADLRLERSKESRLFSRSQRRSEPAVHREGRGVRMTWLGSNLLPPCSSTVRFDGFWDHKRRRPPRGSPGRPSRRAKRWKYRLGATLGVLEAAIAGRDDRRKAIPGAWPRVAARRPHCFEQLGRGLPSHGLRQHGSRFLDDPGGPTIHSLRRCRPIVKEESQILRSFNP
jgi:hypothetical protein